MDSEAGLLHVLLEVKEKRGWCGQKGMCSIVAMMLINASKRTLRVSGEGDDNISR